MRTIEEIDREIEDLKEKLNHLEGRPTEVYTRIVGYYRSLSNWNRGKREEYDHRLLFSQNQKIETVDVTAIQSKPARPKPMERPVRFMYFYRQTCSSCPAVRSLLSQVDTPGCDIDVDTPDGMDAALKFNIYSTPTAIFFNSQSEEIFRATSTEEIRQKLPEGLIGIPQIA